MPPIRFESRMSDADALMWHMEKDPMLRSTITVVWLLDRTPDRDRLYDKIARAVRAIPRLRERVVSNPWSIAPPRWESDPQFDLRFHARWVRAPGDGSLRALLDLVQPIAMQGFDRARPQWELYVVDGLADGKAAMVMKLHHALSDGVGLVHMTNELIELERAPDTRTVLPLGPLPAASVMGQWHRLVDTLGYEARRQRERARRLARGAVETLGGFVRTPGGTARGAAELTASIARLLQPAKEPLSPIMRGRSLSVHFDALALPLEAMRLASKQAAGKLNDAFVAGVAGGLRRYHERHGAPVPALRMSMPINLREGTTGARAGNQFAPARFAVPVGIMDPVARMVAIRDLVGAQRAEPALALVDDVSRTLNRLPLAVSTALFGGMLKSVDFVTSNVPGPRFDVYLSGARVDRVVAFGPLAGAAANITLFSCGDTLNLGINTDPAAVPDPETLVACLEEGFAEVLACAPREEPAPAPAG